MATVDMVEMNCRYEGDKQVSGRVQSRCDSDWDRSCEKRGEEEREPGTRRTKGPVSPKWLD